MVEFEVKQSQNLEDGQYVGIVDHIEYRNDPYEYTDIYIKEQKTGFLLKYGAPSTVSEKTKLGKLLNHFTVFKVGDKLNPETILVGKEVKFMTITEKTKEGEYVRIVDGSIKPAVTTEKVK